MSGSSSWSRRLMVTALVLFALVDTRKPALILAALLSSCFPPASATAALPLGYQIGRSSAGIAPMVAAALYGRWRSAPITLYLGAVSCSAWPVSPS